MKILRKSQSLISRRSWLAKAGTLFAAASILMLGAPSGLAKPRPTKLNVIPTITSVDLVNGELVASGNVTAIIKGQTVTRAFNDVPVALALAADQTGAGACPILDLQLGPITLDLLGLVVETSPICLKITAYDGGGLLGDLLCSVADLLNGGLSLNDILGGLGLLDLPGLTPVQVDALLDGVTDLLNSALGQLTGALLEAILPSTARHVCGILHLELGPIDLTLLGLEVILDDCNGGPVVVDITAVTGQGKLLGNLLCQLLDGGLLQIGATLQDILNALTGLLQQ